MAVIKIEAKKDTRCTQTICLIQGDRRTQILRFGVNRFDGGVDLSDLAWVIKTVNANGVEDVFDPEAVEIGESRITIDWLVDGSVTDADGIAKYELNGLEFMGEAPAPVIWRGGTGTISLRASISPKFGESDGMTNIEKLILYVDGELQNVIDAGTAAIEAAARANHAVDNVEDLSEAVDRANAAAQRATDAAAAVEDIEGATNRANSAASLANANAQNAGIAASEAYSAANRATEAAENVENIEEATLAAHEAAEAAHMAAEVANTAGLPAAMIYGRRVMGETAHATGNPVTFLPDAGSLLQPVTVLEPQQEGSGDPYPAGAGKNKLPITAKTQTINGVTFTVDNGVITANGTATATAYLPLSDAFTLPAGTYVVSGIPDGINYDTTGGFFDDNWNLNRYGVTTLSEAKAVKPYIRINSGQTVTNVVFKLQIEAGSAATAFMPYSNIRPFIGYDKLDLTRHGKNMFTGWVRGETINADTGAFDAVNPNAARTEFIRVKPSTPYCFSNLASGLSNFVAFYDENKNFLGRSARDTGATKAFTSYAQCYYIAFTQYVHSATPGVIGDLTDNVQLEEGSTATDYSTPGTAYTVQLGQTVYGLRYEWLTGKGVIEWAMKTLDGTETVIAFQGEGMTVQRFDVINVVPGILPTSDINLNLCCSHYKTAGNPVALNDLNSAISGYMDAPNIYLRDDTHATADEYKAFLAAQYAAGTPVQIVYKLATPIEIQLTPHIIPAADPEQTNTLYGDGSIAVEYVKPLHVSIEERVAAAVAAAMNTTTE